MTLIAISLLLISGGLIASHIRTWRSTSEEEQDLRAKSFGWRQFRRRMQASGMIGLIGIAFFILQFVQNPLVTVVSWMAVLLVLGWVVLLACGDAWATQAHYSRLRRQQDTERARLQAEIQKLRTDSGNGGC